MLERTQGFDDFTAAGGEYTSEAGKVIFTFIVMQYKINCPYHQNTQWAFRTSPPSQRVQEKIHFYIDLLSSSSSDNRNELVKNT